MTTQRQARIFKSLHQVDDRVTGMKRQSRMFAITDFEVDKAWWEEFVQEHEPQYLICGQEYTKDGVEHYQTFIVFSKKIALSTVIEMVKPRHVEMCMGTAKQNIKYCSKDGNIILEHGRRPQQGRRIDSEVLVNYLKEGGNVDEIVMNYPQGYHCFGRTLLRVEAIIRRQQFRTEPTRGIWYWGKTGVGKSKLAFTGYDPDTHYVFNVNEGWWDGYTGQPVVIINEFRAQVFFSEILDLMDRWPKTVKRKGQESIPFTSKMIIITSNAEPKKVFHNCLHDEEFNQLERRCFIVEVTKENVEELERQLLEIRKQLYGGIRDEKKRRRVHLEQEEIQKKLIYKEQAEITQIKKWNKEIWEQATRSPTEQTAAEAWEVEQEDTEQKD